MTTYGVIADIHGNLEALTAVLAALDRLRVDRVLCLGDVVGYNAEPNQCAALLGARGIDTIAGNHDVIALGRLGPDRCAPKPAFALRRTRQLIDPACRRFLAGLPATRRYDDGRLLLIHGTDEDVTEYLATPAQAAVVARRLGATNPEVRVCLFGHTHVPGVFEVGPEGVTVHQPGPDIPLPAGERRREDTLALVNPGSVDAARRRLKLAEFAILDARRWTVTFHRVGYDDEKAERSAAQQGFRMTSSAEARQTALRWLRRGEGVARRLVQGALKSGGRSPE